MVREFEIKVSGMPVGASLACPPSRYFGSPYAFSGSSWSPADSQPSPRDQSGFAAGELSRIKSIGERARTTPDMDIRCAQNLKWSHPLST